MFVVHEKKRKPKVVIKNPYAKKPKPKARRLPLPVAAKPLKTKRIPIEMQKLGAEVIGDKKSPYHYVYLPQRVKDWPERVEIDAEKYLNEYLLKGKYIDLHRKYDDDMYVHSSYHGDPAFDGYYLFPNGDKIAVDVKYCSKENNHLWVKTSQEQMFHMNVKSTKGRGIFVVYKNMLKAGTPGKLNMKRMIVYSVPSNPKPKP